MLIIPNTIFTANKKHYVILNKEVDFEEVFFDVRWIKTGKLYHKDIELFRKDIENKKVVKAAEYYDSPQDFNLAIGTVFYNTNIKKYFVIIGGSLHKGQYSSRFVECEKNLYRWKKLDKVYTKTDKELMQLQDKNILWYADTDKDITTWL